MTLRSLSKLTSPGEMPLGREKLTILPTTNCDADSMKRTYTTHAHDTSTPRDKALYCKVRVMVKDKPLVQNRVFLLGCVSSGMSP